MSNIFGNAGGGVVDPTGSVIEQRVSVARLSTERALAAYRQNIAMPDVHIADRTVAFVPVILGEDGQELTPERRRQLMAEARVRPMFDVFGEPTGEQYTGAFNTVIAQERLGESAERNRPPIRIVQPRELEVELDIDETTDISVAQPSVQEKQA